MKRTTREEIPTGHTVCEWDDETGDSDLTEYDADGGFVLRFRVQYTNPDAVPGEIAGLRIDLDADGNEIGRADVRSISEADARAGGWD